MLCGKLISPAGRHGNIRTAPAPVLGGVARALGEGSVKSRGQLALARQLARQQRMTDVDPIKSDLRRITRP